MVEAGTVVIPVVADLSGFGNTLGRDVEREVAKASKSFDAFERRSRVIGGALAGVGVAAIAGFSAAVSASAGFTKELSALEAASNASAKDMKSLSNAALEAGKRTSFSAREAAQAATELAKAGIATADILGGGLDGALDLAAAGGLDLADAATLAAQAMNLFSLEGEDVTHIADVLAAGANKSAADVTQLGDALRQGGLVASQTGVSLEETVGTLAAFADNALIGSDAGTSLKTMLQRLNPQSAEAAQLMETLGFNAYDAQGQFVGMDGLAQELQDSLGGMSDEQRNAALNILFGSDAIRGASVLLKLGADGVREYTTAVNDQGAAADTAATRMNNLSGDVEELQGSIETALIGAGGRADGVLRSLTQAATGAVNGFSDLPGPVQDLGVGLLGVGGGLTAVSGGLILAVPKVLEFRNAVRELNIGRESLGKGLSSVASFLTGPWGIALAGAAAGVGIFLETKRRARAEVESFTRAIEQDSGALGENTRSLLANRLEQSGALQAAQTLGVAVEDLVDAIFQEGDARDDLTAKLQAHVSESGELVNVHRGEADAAALLLDTIGSLAPAVERGAEAEKRLAEASTTGTAAAQGQTEAVAEVSRQFGVEGEAAVRLADQLGLTGDATVELTEQQKALGTAVEGFSSPAAVYSELIAAKETSERENAEALAAATDTSEDSWEDFVGAVTVTLGEYATKLEEANTNAANWQTNLVTVAGRAGTDVAQILADMGAEGVQLVADMATGTDEEITRMAEALRTEARIGGQGVATELDQAMRISEELTRTGGRATVQGLAQQLGVGVDEVRRIASAYNLELESAVTAMERTGGAGGAATADAIGAALAAGVPGFTATANSYANRLSAGLNPVLTSLGKPPISTRGGIQEYAEGGQVPGVGDGDTVEALLTPGEYVIRRAAVRNIGVDVLDLLNRGDTDVIVEPSHYAAGGFVTAADVPQPPSFAPFQPPILTAGDAATREAYQQTVEWVKKYGAPALGPGIGYEKMMQALRVPFPGLQLISGFRPGAITATGNPSYHGKGRAVDIPPRLDVNRWIYDHYKTQTKELIFSVGGARQVHNGRDHVYSGITKSMHYDHNHWAMDDGGFLNPGWNMAYNGTGRPELTAPDDKLEEIISRVLDGRSGGGEAIRIDTYHAHDGADLDALLTRTEFALQAGRL